MCSFGAYNPTIITILKAYQTKFRLLRQGNNILSIHKSFNVLLSGSFCCYFFSTNVGKHHYERCLLLCPVLPCGFTRGKHAAHRNERKTHNNDTTHNQRPGTIGNQRWYPGVKDSGNNSCNTTNRTNDTDSQQDRQRDYRFLTKCLPILEIQLEQCDIEE